MKPYDVYTEADELEENDNGEVYEFPASYSQQRLWFLERLMPGGGLYHISAALRLTGSLQIEVLEAALEEIVCRHETLQTYFDEVDGELLQVIDPALPFTLKRADLREIPAEERDEKALAMAREEAALPFDLSRESLIRATLLTMGEGEHLLLLTVHHIVSDGWSMGVLIREFAALYTAFSQGQPSPLPELPIQYADYADWQRRYLAGDVSHKQLAYWKEQLGGELSVLQLPSDRPRPPRQTNRGGMATFRCSRELTDGLNALSKREGKTLYMTLLAAFNAWLHRVSGQSDIAVGTPIANRTRTEFEGLIGFFINTLVMRNQVAGEQSFRELLQRVGQVAVQAYSHQDIPFEKLVEELQPERNLSYSPLFQAMFVMQNTPFAALELPGLSLQLLEIESEVAKFDLTLTMEEDAGELVGRFEYNRDLFEESTMERLVRQFQTLLLAIAAAPDQQVGLLPLLTAEDRNRLLVEWNDTARVFGAADEQHLCAHDLFAAQARRTPDAAAVEYGGQRLTYHELNERANQLARALQRKGVGPETMVGISVERSVEMVVGLLGIMKAGGAYVPLDPHYPAERLAYMREDAALSVLLTQAHLQDLLPAGAEQVLLLDAEWEQIAAESGADLDSGATLDSLAYVIYTSGSTGRPKGVLVPHRGLRNLAFAQIEAFTLQPGSRQLQFASFSFDASVSEVFTALISGATLVLASRDELMPGPGLERLLREGRITTVTLPPSVLSVLGDSEFPDLRTVISAGEACSAEIVARWSKGRRFLNAYGPTEGSVCATIGYYADSADAPTIGRPIANVEVYVLDAMLQPVPVGVPGELYIGGTGLARGYRNRPDLTEAAFLPHPFRADARLYKTGDQVRWLANGEIEYLGRIDDQVKLRGFRIEIGEIEATLREDAHLREVVVLMREDQPGHRQLVAYVTAADGTSVDIGTLRAHVASKLPDYMVPALFVEMDVLPLTPNGKVDRKALPAPDRTLSTERSYVEPATEKERQIADIWADVLHLERVGAQDHFFEIGGHSLLATKVVARIQAATGIELPLRALFEAPTVAGLAQALTEAGGTEASAVPMERVSREDVLPLSFAQERLWFFEQFTPGTSTYNMPAAVRLRGRLDADVLRQSLSEIVRRHESLRTVFASEATGERQIVQDAQPVALDVTDLRALAASDREAQALKLAEQEAQQGFDLTQGPLVRTRLLQLAEEEHILLLTLHHIVSDGWSMGVLLRELADLYAAFANGQPSPLAELPVQVPDFAVWQRAYLQGDVLDRQLGYWKEQLAGELPVLQLPTDRLRGPVQTTNGDHVSFALSEQLTASLHELSRESGATLYMTLLAGFKALLSRYTGQADILVGSPIAGRNRPELEGLIGLFVNTLVLRTDLSRSSTFREMVALVRQTALDAYAHQDVPFEKLVEELQPNRNLSYSPLFQALFSLQNAEMGALQLGESIVLEPLPVSTATAKFDVSMTLVEQDGGLSGTLEYNTDLFDRETIERMIGHFEILLQAAAAAPDRALATLPLLTEPEREQLLTAWNDTGVEVSSACVHELFEAQAARTPDRTAVVFRDLSLTYAELNARANRVARLLREKGVGPDRLVAICTERSLEMLVGLLAIFKAGGAYVPLDPTYPADRLLYVVEDARATVLLTQEHLLAGLPQTGADVICLDALPPTTDDMAGDDLPGLAGPEHLAYVIYTSGSTGKPKGVMIRHRNAANFLAAMDEQIGVREKDVLLAVTSYAFDISVLELFWTITRGVKTVILEEHEVVGAADDREETADAYTLRRQLREQGVTLFQCTPALMRILLTNEDSLPAMAGLRAILLGGEAMPPTLASELTRALPAHLYNMYGPTETTVWSAVHQVTEIQTSIPIGRPVINTELYVLDASGQPVPVGVQGELYIGGHGVAKGYWNRPDLTAERFVPHPFSADPAATLYRTGDLVRYGRDGVVEYMGRTDHQVKIRGFRIELGEIEALLSQHPAVNEAAVTVQDVNDHDKRIIGYVAGTDEVSLSAEELRAYMSGLVPPYMVPSAFVRLDALPLTPNGKIDRKALPVPDDILPTGGEYVAPRTPLEAELCAIWADLLRVPQVGITDNFFELGGHSLLATRLVSRLRSQYPAELSVRLLFTDGSTVEGLARHLEQAGFAAGSSEQTAIPLASRESSLPLSSAQQRMWFLHQFDSGHSASYHIPAGMRMTGRLDRAALEQSFQAIIQRHESLRTTFAERDGHATQTIHADMPFTLSPHDLRALAPSERTAAVSELAAETVSQPFDLGIGPLLRAVLVQTADDEHLLLITMHHIIADGWSLGLLTEELSALYTAFVTGETPELTPLSIQYADFAAWQQGEQQGEAQAAQLAYWKQQLGGKLPLLELPTDRPRPAVPSGRGGVHDFALTAAQVEQVQTLGSQEGATLYMTLLTAFKTLLHRYTGQEDILVGSPIAGRNRQEVEGLIGLFMNTLVLRSAIDSGQSFRDTLRRVQATAFDAYAHQDVPFEKLVEELQPERNMSYTPLFQAMFMLQNTGLHRAEMPGLTMEGCDLETGTAKFDLTLALSETVEGGLSGKLEYNADLFDATTIARFAGHFVTLLDSSVQQPDLPLNELNFLTAAERHQLLVEWNDTLQPAGLADTTIHHLFEAQAARTPDATAVVFEDRSLTFRELNARANQLAHHLQQKGVGPDVLVGICMERSLEMMVGLLGILKAGGAYVPLDPTYPADRIAYMLADSQAKLLLTQPQVAEQLPQLTGDVLALSRDFAEIEGESVANPVHAVNGSHLAYVIYTSGSTGKPKGVQLEHRTVVNFFVGMDERVGADESDALLAVTSICFDISVLELFWTLTRGAKAILLSEEQASGGLARRESRPRTGNGMEFSFFYFSSADESAGGDKYRLLIEGAKFADQNGFKGVWTPERHFHNFGGLYPNPSVIASALAMITEQIELRAGSVVLPLHNPIRVAEEWSVVDNLSKGRVSVSVASGWHADDFVLRPDAYRDRKQIMFDSIEKVRRLWRGDAVPFTGGAGNEVMVKTLPRPVQPELPIWVTAGGHEDTFIQAGAAGANMLTHLLGQSVEELEVKIALYRRSLAEHGHDPSQYRVALMLHTYVSENIDEVRETVRGPFTEYLRSSVGLMQNLAKSLGFGELSELAPSDMDDLLAHAFDRYFETSGLFGTPESCLAMTDRLKAIGVDEVACLIDFGVEEEAVFRGFAQLNELRRLCEPQEAVLDDLDFSIPGQALRHKATLMQCTPSLMKILGDQDGAYQSLNGLKALLLGGEAYPAALARTLHDRLPNTRLLNMYGPTEATVWATTHEVGTVDSHVPIGRPFANVKAYVLNERLAPVPVGVPGELHIGGAALARGYLDRPELTAEKFISSPFADGERLYKTGDLVRYLADGSLEFIGRLDHQVKLRGFRIELGEIETLLDRQPGVKQAVVLVREDVPGDQKLVAYLTADGQVPAAADLRDALKQRLPEYMVPSLFVTLEEFPLTLNGKIDRKSLPAPADFAEVAVEHVAPRTELERDVAAIWSDVLGYEQPGLLDDFFTRGGHSLLATQLISRIRKEFDVEIPLRTLFETSTLGGLTARIEELRGDRHGDEKLAQLLDEIERLTEEEATLLLQA